MLRREKRRQKEEKQNKRRRETEIGGKEKQKQKRRGNNKEKEKELSGAQRESEGEKNGGSCLIQSKRFIRFTYDFMVLKMSILHESYPCFHICVYLMILHIKMAYICYMRKDLKYMFMCI